MNSRIITLLTHFRLEDRKYELMSKEKVFDIDYTHISSVLIEERNKSLEFLKEALYKEEAK